MLSFGLCVVGAPHKHFYRELKPITYRHNSEALKIACQGLRLLEDLKKRNPCYDPTKPEFNARCVFRQLTRNAEPPWRAMRDLNNWGLATAGIHKPIAAAAPTSFDCSFINYYFATFFTGKNPFGHSAEDINSFYRGVVGDPEAHTSDLKLPDARNPPHNALEDALHQEKEMRWSLEKVGYEFPRTNRTALGKI